MPRVVEPCAESRPVFSVKVSACSDGSDCRLYFQHVGFMGSWFFFFFFFFFKGKKNINVHAQTVHCDFLIGFFSVPFKCHFLPLDCWGR